MAISTRQALPRTGVPAPAHRGRGRRRSSLLRWNWFGGAFGWLWLIVVMLPIYWIVITSFKEQSSYFASNPLKPPTAPTLENYRLVIESDFARYFLNSVIVTLGAVIPAVLISFTAAYAIIRAGHRSRFLRSVNALFLMGPASAIAVILVLVGLVIALVLRRIGGGANSQSQLEGA